MEAADILPTVVELSIAIAGFSGVVAALAPARLAQWPTLARLLFAALLLSTSVSASVSLLAMVLLASPLSAATSWMVVSGIHAFFLTGVIVFRVFQGRRAGLRTNMFFYGVIVVMLGITFAQYANVFFYQSEWICLAALAVYAISGFAFFILLVRVLWDSAYL